MIVPYALTRGTSPEEIVVANMTGEVRCIEEGEVLAEIHKVREVVEDNKVLKIKSKETTHEGDEEEATFELDPKLPVVKREALISLLEEFKDRFSWNKDQIGRTNLCELSISLIDNNPIHQHLYRVSHQEREIIKNQVEEMMRRGVIRESNSAYASPVVLVRKKNDEWRFCVDYRKLNQQLKDCRGYLDLSQWMPMVLYTRYELRLLADSNKGGRQTQDSIYHG